MKHGEFKEKIKHYRSSNQRFASYFVFPSFILFIVLFLPFLIHYQDLESQAASRDEIVFVGISLVFAMILGVAGLIVFSIRSKRLINELGLRCPECSKILSYNSWIVMASGRCGDCGAVIIPEITCQHREH